MIEVSGAGDLKDKDPKNPTLVTQGGGGGDRNRKQASVLFLREV